MTVPPTLTAGVLRVVSAFPDPPFEVEPDGGFDAAFLHALCGTMGLAVSPTKYAGSDFNNIFAGLGTAYDAVISGTTITPDRARVALFCDPYLVFNQGLAVNTRRNPTARSTDKLVGLTIGIQIGNTSDIVARRLLANGAIAGIKYYAYSQIRTALDDLESGAIDGMIKLAPVLRRLVAGRPDLAVVAEIPTHERIAIAVAPTNAPLADAINAAQAEFRRSAAFPALVSTWFGDTRGIEV